MEKIEFTRRAFIGSLAAAIVVPKKVLSLPIESLRELPSDLTKVDRLILTQELSTCVVNGTVTPGQFCIWHSDSEVTPLGPHACFDVVSVRTKAAMFKTPESPPAISYDPQSELFQHLKSIREAQNKLAMPITPVYGWTYHFRGNLFSYFAFGPEFLGRLDGQWITYYAGSFTAQKSLEPFRHCQRLGLVAEPHGISQGNAEIRRWWQPWVSDSLVRMTSRDRPYAGRYFPAIEEV